MKIWWLPTSRRNKNYHFNSVHKAPSFGGAFLHRNQLFSRKFCYPKHKTKSEQRVVVGLSGGVDSSVTAHLLIEQGYEVIGMFMRNWVDDSVIISEECPWVEDSTDALAVAEKLGIPFHVIDLSVQYKERIVDYMFREYEKGRTPNPDILCNKEIKFDIFLKAALKLKTDFVATGHCAQKETILKEGKKVHRLLAGADPNTPKLFLMCQLNQEQLSRVFFPIGHLQNLK